MRVENLLGVGKRAVVQTLANDAQVLAHLCVVDEVAGLRRGHLDLSGERRVADSRKSATAQLWTLSMPCFVREGDKLSGKLTSLRAAKRADCIVMVNGGEAIDSDLGAFAAKRRTRGGGERW
jgi:hypothetical protein